MVHGSATTPLSSVSPSAHPLTTVGAVDSPQVSQLPSALWLEDPSAPPPASEPWTPPRPFDPAATLWHLAPSSPSSTIDPLAPPGSLVPTAPLWSVVTLPSPLDSTPPAAPRRSVPPARLDSSFPPAQPRSSITPATLRLSGSLSPPRSQVPPVPPWPFQILCVALDHRLSVSASGSTSTCSATVGQPHGVVSPSSTMAPPSVGSAVGHRHGWDLGSPWLLLLQLPPVFSLAPPSG
ncbi:hypothetical protein QQF64_026209 [Cirrhinus molitorella]|uniref:Uncharacterized protein n=1 Tax=Cirrhinus molitorella TaxID=172907 RepID=A0ABR3NR87_9TELE